MIFLNFSKDFGYQMVEIGTILEARAMLALQL